MWLRSQDDHIISKCTNVQVVKKCVNEINHWIIYNDNQSLGEYMTEKRALYILDQIAFRLTCENYDHSIFTLPQN